MENNLICGVSLCAHALVVKGEEGAGRILNQEVLVSEIGELPMNLK